MTALLATSTVLSGAAALLFATLCVHPSGPLDASAWPAGLLPALLLAGVALGGALAGRAGRRVRRPLRVHAALQLASAAVALVLGPVLGAVLVPGIAAVLALIPAAAFGAVPALLAAQPLSGDARFGRAVGRRVGWLALGGAVGAMASDAALAARTPLVDIALLASLGHTAAALSAFAAAPDGAASEPATHEMAGEGPLPIGAKHLLIAAFLGGALLLALESAGLRALDDLPGNGAPPALAAAIGLAGLGAGSLAGARWLLHRPDAYRTLPSVAFASGAAGAVAYTGVALIADSPAATWPQTLALLLPIPLLTGLWLTMLAEALIRAVPSVMRATGGLAAATAAGAAAGSLAFDRLVLPPFGVDLAVFLLAGGYAIAALFPIFAGLRSDRRGDAILLYSTAGLLIATLVLYPMDWPARTVATPPAGEPQPAE